MNFYKVAEVQSLGSAQYDGNDRGELSFRRTASASDEKIAPKSYYVDGARKLDIRKILKEAAPKYNISDNPSDYLYEAIRANTTNVPNENHDAFHRDELLRFDTKLAKPVYLTYQGKPHHMNHQASDPKRARGVILDAHYNDDTPALAHCPTCNHRTAELEGRDLSGIHCNKCGSVVKDEFVEILVAVDLHKDAALVRGIQEGILNAGSMGCQCSSTTCGVCSHVARSVNDFCSHIRGAAKGSLWLKKGEKFVRTDAESVRNLIKKAGYKVPHDGNLVNVSLVIPGKDKDDSFEIRKAFEFCQGVEFEEYSRVHRPADPKARTVEILKAASSDNVLSLSLEQETENLIRKAKLERLVGTRVASENSNMRENKNLKNFVAVRVNGNDEDIHVAASLKEALSQANLGTRDRGEYFTVQATNKSAAVTKAAREVLNKTAQMLPIEADSEVIIPDGMAAHIIPGHENHDMQNQDMQNQDMQNPQNQGPGGKAVQPGPKSIEDVTQEEMGDDNQNDQDPASWGMMPPGTAEMHLEGEGYSSADSSSSMGTDSTPYMGAEAEMDEHEDHNSNETGANMNEQKFATVYGDFGVEVFSDRAVVSAPGGEILTAKSAFKLTTDESKYAFGGEIMDSLLTNGVVDTALKFNASFSKWAATEGALEGAWFDFQGGRPNSAGGALEGAMTDAVEKIKPTKDVAVSGGATDDYDDDMKPARPKPPENSISQRWTDEQDEAEVASPKETATEGADDDMREKRPVYKMTDDALKGGVTDMKGENKKTASEEGMEALRRRKLKRDLAKVLPDFVPEEDEMDEEMDEELGHETSMSHEAPMAHEAPMSHEAPMAQETSDESDDLKSFLLGNGIPAGLAAEIMQKAKKSKKASTKAVDVALERQKKLYTARMEKLEKDSKAKCAALESTLVDRFARALKIAAKRSALNIEVSPLKAKMIDSLTVARPIGRSAATGAPINYNGLDDGLSLHLVEAAWAESSMEEVDSLLTRAAEIMNFDEKYLASAEKDLSRQAAQIPQVTHDVSASAVDEVQFRAASMRSELENGNMIFASEMTDSEARDDRAAVIGTALNNTRIGRLLSELQ